MDDVKRKVMLDLFASPLTLLPVVGGATALLASWAMGGSPILTFGGVVGMLSGLGMFASRIIFGLEKLTNRAYEYVLQKQQSVRLESLQRLASRLQQDNDPRTERLLARLSTLYEDLKQDIQRGKITVAAHEVLDGVDNMFQVCVNHLDRTYQLWQTASKMRGEARKTVLQQREDLIDEVTASSDYLEATIGRLNATVTRRNTSELSRMRADLDETIRVARLAEERVDALMNEEKPYDISEFE